MNNRVIFEARELLLRRGAVSGQSLNFALRAGQWCVLTGENGSGKTTLLRVLCGLSEPKQGIVCWHGFSIDHYRERYHRAFIYIGHKLGFRGGLSVKENLSFYRDLGSRHGTASIDEAMDYFEISDMADCPYASLSHGQQQRGALCRLITEEAQLWLLDEPTSALDRQGHDIFQELLSKHLNEGGMAIVATHKPFTHGTLQDAHQLRLAADV